MWTRLLPGGSLKLELRQWLKQNKQDSCVNVIVQGSKICQGRHHKYDYGFVVVPHIPCCVEQAPTIQLNGDKQSILQ